MQKPFADYYYTSAYRRRHILRRTAAAAIISIGSLHMVVWDKSQLTKWYKTLYIFIAPTTTVQRCANSVYSWDFVQHSKTTPHSMRSILIPAVDFPTFWSRFCCVLAQTTMEMTWIPYTNSGSRNFLRPKYPNSETWPPNAVLPFKHYLIYTRQSRISGRASSNFCWCNDKIYNFLDIEYRM